MIIFFHTSEESSTYYPPQFLFPHFSPLFLLFYSDSYFSPSFAQFSLTLEYLLPHIFPFPPFPNIPFPFASILFLPFLNSHDVQPPLSHKPIIFFLFHFLPFIFHPPPYEPSHRRFASPPVPPIPAIMFILHSFTSLSFLLFISFPYPPMSLLTTNFLLASLLRLSLPSSPLL